MSNPDDKDDFETYNNAMKYKLALYDMQNALRNKIKHGDGKPVDLDKIREEFFEILKENEVGDLW